MSNSWYTHIGAYFVVPDKDFDVWRFCEENGLPEEHWREWRFCTETKTILIPNTDFEGLKSFSASDRQEEEFEISSLDPQEQIQMLKEYAKVIGDNWIAKFGVVSWGEW